MDISPFQALIRLAQIYQKDPSNQDKYDAICSILLTGIKSQADSDFFESLKQDKGLAGYTINDDPETITRDPTRRYFESQLAAHTLASNLDQLDINKLTTYQQRTFKEIPWYLRLLVPRLIYSGEPSTMANKLSETAAEYSSAIKLIKQGDQFRFLDPHNDDLNSRKSKMLLLVKIAHACMSADSTHKKNYYTLNLKDDPSSPYHPSNRGREARKDEAGNPQQVQSNNLGIMRSFMPLPADDILHTSNAAPYTRPTDKSIHRIDAQAPKDSFSAKLLPFVNSVSGLMLAQLRVITKLVKDNKFPYKNDPQQLKCLFKCFTAYMLFNSGGHSFNEFLRVLQEPAVQKELHAVAGIDQCEVKTLLQDENKEAFEEAITKTFKYNEQILQRKALHAEIEKSNGIPNKSAKTTESKPSFTIIADMQAVIKPSAQSAEAVAIDKANDDAKSTNNSKRTLK